MEAFLEGWEEEQAPASEGKTGGRARDGGSLERWLWAEQKAGLFTLLSLTWSYYLLWVRGQAGLPPPTPPHTVFRLQGLGGLLGWEPLITGGHAELLTPQPSSPAPFIITVHVHLNSARPTPTKTKKMIS